MARFSADALFETYFLPLYPEDARSDLTKARATDANPAKNPSVIAHLEDAARTFVANAPLLFGEDLTLDLSDASVHRLSHAITAERRDVWANTGAPGTAESALFNVIVHGAAYVGQCVVAKHGGVWSLRRPLWESMVELSSRAGRAHLAIFHWWLKSMESEATTLADRYRAHVEVPCSDPEAWPVLVPAGRRLPRITKVRYDVLYKHIKAHLPELRDLGADFPSPERFEELGFRWLDFLSVGGGRMLLLFGPTSSGLHLFWLDGAGFQKAAFYPADAFPEPIVRAREDKIEVIVSVQQQTRAQEMLWWGP